MKKVMLMVVVLVGMVIGCDHQQGYPPEQVIADIATVREIVATMPDDAQKVRLEAYLDRLTAGIPDDEPIDWTTIGIGAAATVGLGGWAPMAIAIVNAVRRRKKGVV